MGMISLLLAPFLGRSILGYFWIWLIFWMIWILGRTLEILVERADNE